MSMLVPAGKKPLSIRALSYGNMDFSLFLLHRLLFLPYNLCFSVWRLLEKVVPVVRLQVEEEYDLCVLKALRMNGQRDEALEALDGIKDRKTRVMFATLLEHLPLEKEIRIAEETFVATYIAPILLGTLRANEKISIHFPNTMCITQRDQGMRPDRPDIVAKVGKRELLFGEVTGPCQETYRSKNAWDLYRLARFGKPLLGDNPCAPLLHIINTKGVYMKLTIKARGMFLLERVGTFVIPTTVDMVPALLGTIQTLTAAKEGPATNSIGKTLAVIMDVVTR